MALSTKLLRAHQCQALRKQNPFTLVFHIALSCFVWSPRTQKKVWGGVISPPERHGHGAECGRVKCKVEYSMALDGHGGASGQVVGLPDIH